MTLMAFSVNRSNIAVMTPLEAAEAEEEEDGRLIFTADATTE
jgi:hypothetical protein